MKEIEKYNYYEQKYQSSLAVAAHAFNPCTREVEAGRAL